MVHVHVTPLDQALEMLLALALACSLEPSDDRAVKRIPFFGPADILLQPGDVFVGMRTA